jgi:hypothetical protein
MSAKDAVSKLIDNWPHAKVTPTQMDSYERVMNEVDEGMRERLIQRLVDDHDFLPSVYLVRQAWKSMQPPPVPEPEPEFIRSPTPEWVDGCYQCNFGIQSAPPIKLDTLAMERLQQARAGDVTFCTCEAGKAQRKYFLKLHKRDTEWRHEEAIAANGSKRGDRQAQRNGRE